MPPWGDLHPSRTAHLCVPPDPISQTGDGLGKKELHNGAGTAVESTAEREQEWRVPVAPMGDGGDELQGVECVRRATRSGCPENTAQLGTKGYSMAGTQMCDGLPTGAGLGKEELHIGAGTTVESSRIVPGWASRHALVFPPCVGFSSQDQQHGHSPTRCQRHCTDCQTD